MLSLYAFEAFRLYKVCIGLALGMLAELEGTPIYLFRELKNHVTKNWKKIGILFVF